jgi:hypothetical protein
MKGQQLGFVLAGEVEVLAHVFSPQCDGAKLTQNNGDPGYLIDVSGISLMRPGEPRQARNHTVASATMYSNLRACSRISSGKSERRRAG